MYIYLLNLISLCGRFCYPIRLRTACDNISPNLHLFSCKNTQAQHKLCPSQGKIMKCTRRHKMTLTYLQSQVCVGLESSVVQSVQRVSESGQCIFGCFEMSGVCVISSLPNFYQYTGFKIQLEMQTVPMFFLVPLSIPLPRTFGFSVSVRYEL